MSSILEVITAVINQIYISSFHEFTTCDGDAHDGVHDDAYDGDGDGDGDFPQWLLLLPCQGPFP